MSITKQCEALGKMIGEVMVFTAKMRVCFLGIIEHIKGIENTFLDSKEKIEKVLEPLTKTKYIIR